MINRANVPAPRLSRLPARAATRALYKVAAAILRASVTDATAEQAAHVMFGKDHGLDLILRAASAPATLTSPAWAGPLAHDLIYSQVIQKLTGLSAAAGLMTQGVKVDLTGAGSITIPGRVYNPASAGDWIGEGMPIPMRQPVIALGPKLVPRKLGVLATFTDEMIRADSIVDFTEAAIREGSAALLDKQMFSTNAGDATHPPGILLGADVVTPTTTTTAAWAISTDIGNLVGALAANGGGLEPIIVAAPSQAASLRMWRQADFYTILASVALAPGTVVAVESSSFVSGLDGVPEFSSSVGATLHFEDTTPTDIVPPSGVPASPVKSLFQTDVVGLKMILRASWGMRNAKHVAWMQGTSW
jgi:hypothetical protein